MASSELTPPDFSRCQADKPTGHNAFTLGPGPKYIRCTAKPRWLVEEAEPGEDGLMGQMTLCDDCAKVLFTQEPDRATVAEIIPEAA